MGHGGLLGSLSLSLLCGGGVYVAGVGCGVWGRVARGANGVRSSCVAGGCHYLVIPGTGVPEVTVGIPEAVMWPYHCRTHTDEHQQWNSTSVEVCERARAGGGGGRMSRACMFGPHRAGIGTGSAEEKRSKIN